MAQQTLQQTVPQPLPPNPTSEAVHTQKTHETHKVLVLAYYFPPMGLSGVQRTLKFTKYMKKFGWEPTVLTAGAVGYYAFDEALMREAEEANIRIERTSGLDVNSLLASKGASKQISMPMEWLRKLGSRLSNALFIPDNKLGWANKAFKRASDLLQTERYDLIFVSAPPFSAARVGATLSKQFSVPFVVDYRDLWYGNQFAFYPTPLHRWLHQRFEYAMLEASSKVIVTNRQMKQKIMTMYPFLGFDDISIISHGFDPEDFAHARPAPRNNQKFRLGYAGMFYDIVTPKYFLQAFKMLADEQPNVAQDIELHFFGLFRKEHLKRIRRMGLQDFVTIHGYRNHTDSVSGIMSCDALWMMVGNARNADTISSGKLYEYFGSQKPLLVSVPEGALSQAAQKYDAAIVTEPDNIQQIKLAILRLYKSYKEDKLPTPNLDVIQQYRRDVLTEQLTKELHFVVEQFVG
jgi:glycosyltransferase involved in cell wall biosynthesis